MKRGLEELILDPEKLSEEEVNEFMKAYKVVKQFLKRVEELAIVNEHEAIAKSARSCMNCLTLEIREIISRIDKQAEQYYAFTNDTEEADEE